MHVIISLCLKKAGVMSQNINYFHQKNVYFSDQIYVLGVIHNSKSKLVIVQYNAPTDRIFCIIISEIVSHKPNSGVETFTKKIFESYYPSPPLSLPWILSIIYVKVKVLDFLSKFFIIPKMGDMVCF